MAMDSQTLFTERQKFQQWWLWLILLAVNGFLLYGIFKQVIGGKQFGDRPMNNTELVFLTIFILVLTFLVLSLRLETVIKKDGVYVRFFPFHLKHKHYKWESITKSFVRQYSAIGEYGGWGLRFGLFGKGTAFNVSGDQGLQLEFTNTKKLLIGTNKPVELTEVLKKTGRWKLEETDPSSSSSK